MSGWWIVIDTKTPEDLQSAAQDGVQTRLASYETGFTGLAWINDLVADGEAVQVSNDCYPSFYTAPARAILPRVMASLAAFEAGEGSGGHAGVRAIRSVDRARLESCDQDMPLTVMAYDLS